MITVETKKATLGPRVLRTDKLVKIYGGRAVVNGVDINCHSGEIVGLLGPNGAGKTTSFYMVVGLVRPNSGQRFIFKTKEVTDHSDGCKRAAAWQWDICRRKNRFFASSPWSKISWPFSRRSR